MPLFKYGAAPVETILVDGYITFPLLQVLGNFKTRIDGDVYLPLLSAQGLFGAEGNATLPSIRVYGKMQDEINGEILIPLLRVTSAILGSSAISGDIWLPVLNVSGDMQVECNIDLPILRVFGTLQNQVVMSGSVTISRIQVLGEITQIQYLAGNIILPVILASGTISHSLVRTIEGAVIIPVLRIDGIIFNSTYSFSEDDVVLRYDSSRRLI